MTNQRKLALCLFTSAICLLPSAISAFQDPPDRYTLPSTPGASVIQGRVVAADTGRPLRRVEVAALNSAVPRNTRSTVTDDQGRYEFNALAAGAYTLRATRNGYVTTSYGQRRPADLAQTINLAAGQKAERIDLSLPRGSAIVVKLTDDFGEPLPGMMVMLQQFVMVEGQRRLMGLDQRPVETDDRGEARAADLAAGTYYVAIDPNVPRLGPMLDSSQSGRRFTITYYPGTHVAAEARPVRLGAGQEATVAMPIVAVKTARVSGTARRSDGQPALPGSLWLAEDSSPSVFVRPVPLSPDGSFSASDLPPGEYSVLVQPDGFENGPPAGRTGRGGPPIEYARVPVSINGEDVAGVVVTSARGATLRGRLEFEGTPPAPGSRGPQVSIVPTVPIAARGPRTAAVGEDGTFEITDVALTGVIRMAPPPGGQWQWDLKAVWVDGRDMIDVPTAFGNAKVYDDVRLVLTPKRTTVTGSVTDGRTPIEDYVAIVFAEDRERWTPYSRFVSVGRPDQTGAFRVSGLPPGRYLAAAVPTLEAGGYRDPALLDALEQDAARFSLAEGETRTVALRLVVR